MPEQINGLPTHVLLVHAVVVLVPLAAALLVAAALLPALRARLGAALPALAAACALLLPLTTNAGEQLQRQVGGGPLVQAHVRLADGLLPWTLGVLALSLVVWWRGRQVAAPMVTGPREPVGLAGSAGSARSGLLVPLAVAGLSLAVAVGSVVQVVRIGESGSRAVWSGVTVRT